MKESGADVAQLADLVVSTPASFTVLAGSATTAYAALAFLNNERADKSSRELR